MMSKENPLCLDGKVAVISGGASGIGFATGKLLAEYGGAKVALLDVNKELGNKAAKEIENEGGELQYLLHVMLPLMKIVKKSR